MHRLRPLAWLGGLLLSHVLLVAAGERLPTPPIAPAASLAAWVRTTPPDVAAFTVLRLVALAITWYLLALTVLALLGQARGLHPLGTLSDRLAVPAARSLVHHMVGVGLSVTLATPAFAHAAPPSTVGGAPERPATVVTMELLDGSTDPTAASGPTVEMTLLDDQPLAEPGAADPPVVIDLTTVPSTAAETTTSPSTALTVPSDTAPAAPTPATPTTAPGTTVSTTDTTGVPGPAEPPTAGAGPGSTVPATPDAARAPTSPPAPAGPPHDTPAPPGGSSVATPSAPLAAEVRMRLVPDAPDPSAPAAPVPVDVPSGQADAADPSSIGWPPPPSDAGVPVPSWTIEPGDHLWHVAEATLTQHLGRPATDGTVARYLGDVIELNRDRLVVADNPDLVLPGQVFLLPPVPADAA